MIVARQRCKGNPFLRSCSTIHPFYTVNNYIYVNKNTKGTHFYVIVAQFIRFILLTATYMSTKHKGNPFLRSCSTIHPFYTVDSYIYVNKNTMGTQFCVLIAQFVRFIPLTATYVSTKHKRNPFLRLHNNNIYANAPQCCVLRTLILL